ncbi:class I lanthipeptide [Flavobacteriaceae bacterium M23B6Z8]
MKKKNFSTKLMLNKKAISSLNKDNINGGFFTTGCSDGCSPAQTQFNCTNGACSKDCHQGVSDPRVCTMPGDQFFDA